MKRLMSASERWERARSGMPIRPCKCCKRPFKLQSGSSKYCSDKCRFFGKIIIKDGCWGWTGSVHLMCGKWPRARLNFAGKCSVYANIASWFIHHGSWPPSGMEVCHTCDNGLCTNPAHLFLGTHKENMIDCANKNRNGNPLSAFGKTQTAAAWAREYGIPTTTLSRWLKSMPIELALISHYRLAK